VPRALAPFLELCQPIASDRLPIAIDQDDDAVKAFAVRFLYREVRLLRVTGAFVHPDEAAGLPRRRVRRLSERALQQAAHEDLSDAGGLFPADVVWPFPDEAEPH
jgi:hypothetical protein